MLEADILPMLKLFKSLKVKTSFNEFLYICGSTVVIKYQMLKYNDIIL